MRSQLRRPASSPGMTPRAGRRRPRRAPTLNTVNALAQVIAGRDAAPAWRSAATRRAAYAAAAAGWALLAAAAIAEVAAGVRGPHGPHGTGLAGWLAGTLAVGAALLLTPRFPLAAWRLAWLAVLIAPLIPSQNRVDTGYYTILAIVYVVAALRYGPPRLWWLAVLTLIPVWLWTGPDWTYPIRLTVALAVLTAALYGIRAWRGDRQRLAAQTQLNRHQRERTAVLEERARIARELHDVVAHHMSMIAVQAETAPYRLAAKPGAETLPEPVSEEFAALGQAAREALIEMRRLLGVLRTPDNSKKRGSAPTSAPTTAGTAAPAKAAAEAHVEAQAETQAETRAAAALAPQPRLDDVPELVATARRAGAAVTLQMPGNGEQLPASVGLTAYRIVQESLSNAARHAPGARISVTVDESPPYVRITVSNEPPATGQPHADGTTQPGHGLAGMRERVTLLGGRLRTGPEPDGGFAVRAVLPMNDTAGPGEAP
jgi:signal transduction histidine kinase